MERARLSRSRPPILVRVEELVLGDPAVLQDPAGETLLERLPAVDRDVMRGCPGFVSTWWLPLVHATVQPRRRRALIIREAWMLAIRPTRRAT